jgi:hypothetical protein
VLAVLQLCCTPHQGWLAVLAVLQLCCTLGRVQIPLCPFVFPVFCLCKHLHKMLAIFPVVAVTVSTWSMLAACTDNCAGCRRRSHHVTPARLCPVAVPLDPSCSEAYQVAKGQDSLEVDMSSLRALARVLNPPPPRHSHSVAGCSTTLHTHLGAYYVKTSRDLHPNLSTCLSRQPSAPITTPNPDKDQIVRQTSRPDQRPVPQANNRTSLLHMRADKKQQQPNTHNTTVQTLPNTHYKPSRHLPQLAGANVGQLLQLTAASALRPGMLSQEQLVHSMRCAMPVETPQRTLMPGCGKPPDRSARPSVPQQSASALNHKLTHQPTSHSARLLPSTPTPAGCRVAPQQTI